MRRQVAVCVGGHDLNNDMRSVRLLKPDGANMPADTGFAVGHIWDLDYTPREHTTPPHVEDVLVSRETARHLGDQPELDAFLRANAVVWEGPPFEGRLARTEAGAGYVPVDGPFPSCSTGYWLAPADLWLDNYGRYRFKGSDGTRRVRYVGVAESIAKVSIGTLLRLSLARRHKPENAPEGFYLQLSGWYGD